GPYPDDNGEIVPRHIHFNVSAPGYRDFNAEFVFEGDPLLTDAQRDAALGQGHPLATRLGAGNNYRVEIPLQRQ
ncbi:MAG: hypothetical protein R3301_15700, partial [Saprospiraceae bacterium]|nr:hypothetical protein [Saprospiraceae bacterium]